MSITFLIVEIILYGLYILFYCKNKKKFNLMVLNPPKIMKFNIDEDFEEDKTDNKNKNSEDKKREKVNIENKEDNKDLIIPENNNIIKINENYNNKDINSYLQKEDEFKYKIKFNRINLKGNKRSIRNISKLQKSAETEESLMEAKINKYTNKKNEEEIIPKEEIKEKQNKIDNIDNLDNIKNEEIKTNKLSFWEYYLKLLILKQPIINLFGCLNSIKINNKIPALVKLMKFIFVLTLNIFFNILHLDQNYFRKKYEYFNNKYNIRYVYLTKEISFNERLLYGFKNTIIPGVISFLIYFIIQSIINYYCFSVGKYINKDNKKKPTSSMSEKERKKYIILFGVEIIIMIFIFYSLIVFNEVYRGGFSDLLAAFIWTFIFLQITPFILLFNYALIKYNKD